MPAELTEPGSVWSAELELVARLATICPSEADGDRARALTAGGVDWDGLLRLVRHHRVVALVAANLAELSPVGVPGRVTETLRGFHGSMVRANLRRHADWLAVCRTLEERGIVGVTLKGIPVALETYGSLGRRRVGDLDILVHERDVPRALDALRETGYRSWWDPVLRRIGLPHLMRSRPEMQLVSTHGTTVDLHWRTEWNARVRLPAERILSSRTALAVGGGQEVHVPSPDLGLALLLLHGYGSSTVRLYSTVDVLETMARLPPPLAASALERIREFEAGRFLRAAGWVVQGLWNRPLPPPFGAEARAGVADPRLVTHLRAMLEVGEHRRPARRAAGGRLLAAIRARRAMGGSVREVLAPLVRPSTADWLALRLPRRWTVAYYLVRPIRVILSWVAPSLHRTLLRRGDEGRLFRGEPR